MRKLILLLALISITNIAFGGAVTKTMQYKELTTEPSTPSAGVATVFYKDGYLNVKTADGEVAPVGRGGLSPWESGRSYKVGDVVYGEDKVVYRCLNANSDLAWTDANWERLNPNDVTTLETPDASIVDSVLTWASDTAKSIKTTAIKIYGTIIRAGRFVGAGSNPDTFAHQTGYSDVDTTNSTIADYNLVEDRISFGTATLGEYAQLLPVVCDNPTELNVVKFRHKFTGEPTEEGHEEVYTAQLYSDTAGTPALVAEVLLGHADSYKTTVLSYICDPTVDNYFLRFVNTGTTETVVGFPKPFDVKDVQWSRDITKKVGWADKKSESIVYSGFISKNGSNHVLFKTLDVNRSDFGSVVAPNISGDTRTSFDVIEDSIVTVVAGVYGTSNTSLTVLHYDKDGTQVHRTGQGNPYSYVGSALTTKALKGDYFVVNFNGATTYDDTLTSFSITATPIDLSPDQGELKRGGLDRAGVSFFHNGSVCPDGSLAEDGRELNKVDFPDLYKVVGCTYGCPTATTFKVADNQGLFKRGVGTNGTIAQAVGGVLGETQEDTLQDFTISFGARYSDSGATASIQDINRFAAAGNNGIREDRIASPSGARIGAETRPSNRSLLSCVWYSNYPIAMIAPDGMVTTTPEYVQKVVNNNVTAEYRNEISLRGSDGRALTVNTESVYFSGTGNGWTSGADNSTPETGNYYTVQRDNSTVDITVGVGFTAQAQHLIVLTKNGAVYRYLSDYPISGFYPRGKYTSVRGEFKKGDKLAFEVQASGGTLSSEAYHYLNIVEIKLDAGVLITANEAGVGDVFFTFGSCPIGSLSPTGQTIQRADYPKLDKQLCDNATTAIGCADPATIVLPDMRGLAVRGAGSNGTITQATGGAVGEVQQDQFQGHKHRFLRSGVTDYGSYTRESGTGSSYNSTADIVTDGTNGTPRVGGETRMSNISLTPCLRYEPRMDAQIFAKNAVIYDKKPVKLFSSSTQNTFTMSGTLATNVMPFDTVDNPDYAVESNGVRVKRKGKYKISVAGGLVGNAESIYVGYQRNGVDVYASSVEVDNNGAGSWAFQQEEFYSDFDENDLIKGIIKGDNAGGARLFRIHYLTLELVDQPIETGFIATSIEWIKNFAYKYAWRLSPSEHQIGIYESPDGKVQPLYQRSFETTVTMINNAQAQLVTIDPNLTIVELTGVGTSTDGTMQVALGGGVTSGYMYYSTTDGRIVALYQGSNLARQRFTVRYTKDSENP